MNDQAPIQQDQPEAETPFLIESIDQFGELVTNWHTNAVSTLKHMLDVPTGMEVVIEGEDPFKMEGDIQRGYKLGINIALTYLGALPFSAGDVPDESTHH